LLSARLDAIFILVLVLVLILILILVLVLVTCVALSPDELPVRSVRVRARMRQHSPGRRSGEGEDTNEQRHYRPRAVLSGGWCLALAPC
jgi:uncharacterized membrane protein YqiK